MTVTVPLDSDAATPFSAQLKERTWAWHQQAEDSGFLRAVAAGTTSRSSCIAMAMQHHRVYATLDGHVAARRGDPQLTPFVDHDDLARTPHLEADLTCLVGDDWRIRLTYLPAADIYAARIDAVADSPATLVAHHYIRYLGDLSGGLMIGRGFARALDLRPGDPGTTFYTFASIAKPAAFKDTYRAHLDANTWTADERAAFLDEVVLAYELNQSLYQQLADLGPTPSSVT